MTEESRSRRSTTDTPTSSLRTVAAKVASLWESAAGVLMNMDSEHYDYVLDRLDALEAAVARLEKQLGDRGGA